MRRAPPRRAEQMRLKPSAASAGGAPALTGRQRLQARGSEPFTRRRPMAEFPAPEAGIVLTHFIVSGDVERSRRFYTDVLGGETVRAGGPSFVSLANSWVIINVGGGP